jgi:hypothetical protein
VTKTAAKSTTKHQSTKSMKKSASARSGKKRGPATDEAAALVGKDDVTIDRRHSSERRDEISDSAEASSAPTLERRKKVNRRRQIDPTTCERDYTDQEVEFMNALDDYKRKSGRMFPTCSEVLEVIHSLGYVKLSHSQMAVGPASHSAAASAKPMPSDLQTAVGLPPVAADEQLV